MSSNKASSGANAQGGCKAEDDFTRASDTPETVTTNGKASEQRKNDSSIYQPETAANNSHSTELETDPKVVNITVELPAEEPNCSNNNSMQLTEDGSVASHNCSPINSIKSGDQEEDESLMPAEQLDSDNSDVAGYYPVQAARSSDIMRQSKSTPSYQRGEPDNEESSSSDGSESSSDDESDDKDTDEDLPTNKPNNLGVNITTSHMDRQIGGRKRRYSEICYQRDVMSNISLVSRLKLTHELNHHDGCVNSLHWNQTGTLLASGSDDLNIILWDVFNSGKPRSIIKPGHTSNIFQSKFMPNSNDTRILSCARDGQVRLSQLDNSGNLVTSKRLAQHKDSAHKLALEAETAHCFLSCGEDSFVFQIDLRQPQHVKLAQAKNGTKRIPIYSIDKHPFNTNYFIVSGRDNATRLFDKRKLADSDDIEASVKSYIPKIYHEESAFRRDVTCAMYNYDGSEIVASYNDGDIFVFDSEDSDDAKYQVKGRRNTDTVKGVNFYGPRSEYIVSGSDCGTLYIWEKTSQQIVLAQEGDIGGVVNVLEPHPRFPYLAISGLDDSIKVFLPVSDTPCDLTKFFPKIRQNMRLGGVSGRSTESSEYLWLIMDRLSRAQQRLRRRMNTDDESEEELPPDDDSSSESEDDDDLLARIHNGRICAQS